MSIESDFLDSAGKGIFWGSAALGGASLACGLSQKKRVYTNLVAAHSEPTTVNDILDPTAEARAKIVELWNRIANNEIWGLWELGRAIEHDYQVHPLALMLHLPKNKLKQTFDDQSFTTTTFRLPPIVKGFGDGIKNAFKVDRPAHWPEFWTLLPAFAARMDKDPETIRRWIIAEEWRALLQYLYELYTPST